ncbi:OLC1v1000917C4 [Oldenlandia corymbosa var. corymbosa]|uniref:OLC1v1000917C4 n=2 Tax=Oldenlandia corymbosa var. corymbosa TaxID=529605 RepID=A0AAV1D720_OLDCO|nr:OLC1v1000917C4 [Oldenlandia corymbosa var. corymbosa]
MVTRKFVVNHNGSSFDVDYDADDGFEVFKFQLFSLTSVPPDQQKIMAGENGPTILDDSDLLTISNKLKLVSINDGEKEKSDAEFSTSDEELARILQAEEDALMMQQFVAAENTEIVDQRIRPYVDQVLMYEDPHRQEAARKTVPIDKLEEKALVALAREGTFQPSKPEQDHAFLLQLLFWFKQSFRWVNSPPCDSCGNESTRHGMGVANSSETRYAASRVELYRCTSCLAITRFPRYNDPLKLLETRKGRCGEWANCFTLYCRAFNYESRLILDFTDHVWTECHSPHLGRWMHLDPCEGIFDNPLLYEKGWKKNLNYVIGIARDGVYDVTKRYTRKWSEVLGRRTLTTESALAISLSNITKERRKSFASQTLHVLEERDRNEAEVLQRELYSKDNGSISLPGRMSGDVEWRVARSEFGSQSLGLSSCPVRKCIDDHVTKIYNSLSPILSQLVEVTSSKTEASDIIRSMKEILVNLKNTPFKTRRISVDSVSYSAKFMKMVPSFSKLLDALSLKIESDVNGSMDICLSSDPVKTSLALPVVFHALDDLILHINHIGRFDNTSISWPLLKLNRLSCGFVLASGEELPFGIATSAFDGTRMSKWEEPNGATGCWIIYKLLGDPLYKIVAYELMSANDAPERDPAEWVLEASQDGGSSWHILDKQTAQKFEERFQRKLFKINSPGISANTFRFRFTSVRDPKSTSRFQIGSIDLYSSEL